MDDPDARLAQLGAVDWSGVVIVVAGVLSRLTTGNPDVEELAREPRPSAAEAARRRLWGD